MFQNNRVVLFPHCRHTFEEREFINNIKQGLIFYGKQ